MESASRLDRSRLRLLFTCAEVSPVARGAGTDSEGPLARKSNGHSRAPVGGSGECHGCSERERKTQVGDRVRFSATSIFLPEAAVAVLPPSSEIEGVIVEFSDSGAAPRAFAVVEIVRTETVVVPVDKL